MWGQSMMEQRKGEKNSRHGRWRDTHKCGSGSRPTLQRQGSKEAMREGGKEGRRQGEGGGTLTSAAAAAADHARRSKVHLPPSTPRQLDPLPRPTPPPTPDSELFPSIRRFGGRGRAQRNPCANPTSKLFSWPAAKPSELFLSFRQPPICPGVYNGCAGPPKTVCMVSPTPGSPRCVQLGEPESGSPVDK